MMYAMADKSSANPWNELLKNVVINESVNCV